MCEAERDHGETLKYGHPMRAQLTQLRIHGEAVTTRTTSVTENEMASSQMRSD